MARAFAAQTLDIETQPHGGSLTGEYPAEYFDHFLELGADTTPSSSAAMVAEIIPLDTAGRDRLWFLTGDSIVLGTCS